MSTFFVICLLSFAMGLAVSGLVKVLMPAPRLVRTFPVLDGIELRILRVLGASEVMLGALVAFRALGHLEAAGNAAVVAGICVCIGAIALHLKARDFKGAVGAVVLLVLGGCGAVGLLIALR